MSMPSTSSVAGGPPDTNRQLFSFVKQERQDEAEILELAAKMMESHKAQMTKAAQQQAMQQQMRSVNVINTTGQTNILNYFQRKPSQQGSSSLQAAGTSGSIVPASTPAAAASTVAATNGGAYANGKQPNGETAASASPDGEKKACDEESQKGHFGWHTFNKSIYIPYILRSGEKYCAVRIVESKLLNKYLNYLHHDIYSCTCVRSYYITEAEGRLLNEINHKHSEAHYGREMFTVKDLVVRLSDVSKFWTFLDVCYKKLLMGNNGQGQSEKCGFIRINKESVVPYTVRDGQKFVPLFYFEGETENLKLKADNLSGWDLSYLKFCCKVQGIRNELFASDKVAVISLTDIKSYFPPGTQFEDYWPNKVVDTQLLVQKSNANSSVHWTRQPTAPPPKATATTQPKTAPARKQATSVSYNATMSQVNMQQRLPSQLGSTNTPVVSNVWSNLSSVPGLNLTPGQQEHVLRMAQAAQAQSQRGYPTTRSQVQNIMQRQPYNVNFPPGAAAAAAMSAMTGLSSNANQVPPPLIRGAQQTPTSHHMSSCVTGPPSLRSSNSLTINPVATPSHLLPPPPPYNASNNHLQEYLLASVSLASSPKSSPYGNSNTSKSSFSASPVYNNNNSDFLLNNNILSAIYSKTPITSTANMTVGSPARASPNQNHSVSSGGQSKQPPPPLIPMPNTTNNCDAFSSIRDTLQQLRNLKSLTTTFLPQNIPIPNPYSSPSPTSHVAGATSPFSLLHSLSIASAAQNLINTNPPTTSSVSLANRQTKSVTMSATDVIDLSSPPRSATSLLHHQQQQQQMHQQQRNQQLLTNGRCSTNAQQQNLMHGANAQNLMHHGVPSSATNAAAQVAAMQQHQRQSSVDASRLSAIPEMVSHNGNVPYKMQKAQIDGCTVPCINMKAYTHNELLMTLADLKDIFFPHMTLENCRKVLDVLNVELYKGNRSQLKVFQEYGHHGMENMALVLVRDIINFMPQLKYMVRSQPQEQPAHKRARIS